MSRMLEGIDDEDCVTPGRIEAVELRVCVLLHDISVLEHSVL
jgi:hypothetical protein